MKNLATLRQARGLSQTKLAAKIGTSQANICKYENKQMVPRPETAKRIAAALKCKIEELTA